MSGLTYTCEIAGNVVRTPGVDFGRPLEILHRKGDYLVLRCKGHMTWCSVGEQRYAETHYDLVQVGKEKISAKRSFTNKAWTREFFEVIERVEPGLKWREALKKLIERCDSF
jgi:hypothetical protein